MKGSSPLTRGKPTTRCARRGTGGLIPAHAGKTWPPRPRVPSWWAHPRSRGENRAQRTKLLDATGSSPLTRGKPELARPTHTDQGLIPAHAGKTMTRLAICVRRRAHPRSRGENTGCSGCFIARVGSSPLTRGKLPRGGTGRRVRGLIPAHAGKTTRKPPPTLKPGAHPRSRGENLQANTP